MDNLKDNLKGVVGSSPHGISLKKLEREYENLTGSRMEYQSIGYSSLLNYLHSIPEVVKIVEKDGQPVVRMTLGSDDPRCLRNLLNLVNNNAPVNKSVIKNKHALNGWRNKQIKYELNEMKKLKQSRAMSVLNGCHRPCMSGVSSGLITPSDLGDVSSQTVADDRDKSTSDISFDENNRSSDSGSWFVRPSINYEPFHKEVNILGIQSSHAVVCGVSTKLANVLLPSQNVVAVFPGDIKLWQPPFKDELRTKNKVDVNTAFPATVMKRINVQRVQVRILGLITILEVAMCDLFEMPQSSAELLQMVRHIESRQITLLPLALIPKGEDVWTGSSYEGTYKVLFSIDEGGSILEKMDSRGTFLNLSLLRHIKDRVALCEDLEQKTSFLDHITYCVDRCLAAMLPTYETLLSGSEELRPEDHPLSLVYKVGDCDDRMLLGSNWLPCPEKELLKKNRVSRARLVLRRMKFWDSKSGFYSVDDKQADVLVRLRSPLLGIYALSEDFARSSASMNDPLRFRTALLTNLPCVVDLRACLGLQASEIIILS